ncbi:Tat [Symbiodinium sp. KB8]|nr:Tat [Symbiodinium sp. KB8]
MAAADSTAPSAAKRRKTWHIEPSAFSKRVHNPIRAIVDNIKKPDDPDKELIPLSLGDPTVFGNFKTPQYFVDKLQENLLSFKHNGYVHSAGPPAARAAVAARYGTATSPLTAEDVVITCGCSGALDFAIGVLLSPGQKLLLPRPGFPLYATLAASKCIDVEYYNLDPAKSWEIDLEHLESVMDPSVGAILVNNPSNPCGSVFSKEHLQAILAIADKHKVPIIADEIYGDMTFPGHTFHPIASLTSTVPVLATGGIAKQFLVPGWRVGWVKVHDQQGLLGEVREALFRMSQLILGANSLIQSALPSLLTPPAGSPDEAALATFKAEVMEQLHANAQVVADGLAAVPGITPIVPQGAMYVMIGIDVAALDGVVDDQDFCQKLLTEQSVFMLPGACFGMPNYARVVFSAPKAKLEEAVKRIAAFCEAHAKSS